VSLYTPVTREYIATRDIKPVIHELACKDVARAVRMINIDNLIAPSRLDSDICILLSFDEWC
jgi:hypothetical protein